MITPVVLSGGSGTRLWPLSRQAYPKQFTPVLGKYSLFQEVILRIKSCHNMTNPIFVCNEEHRFLLDEQSKSVGCDSFTALLEPIGRNTAPAIALAAFYAKKLGQDPIFLVLPADHAVVESKHFQDSINLAKNLALKNKLVTFGIKPSKPETGYGYIKSGHEIITGAYDVECFIEKPDKNRAEQFVKNSNYFWNSGMFMFKASVYLEELKKFAFDIYQCCEMAVNYGQVEGYYFRPDMQYFIGSPSDSIDYAIMEKTTEAVVVPMDIHWSDMGTWSSLWEWIRDETHGNVIIGDVITENVENCYIRADGRMVAAVGMSDHVVVETDDVVLVAHKDSSQDIKTLVERLKHSNRHEVNQHRKVHRPWGWFESITKSDGFQVKRLTINPNASISLQMHHHRSEHWVVVKGQAEVVCGDKTLILEKNKSIYIPKAEKHRLKNIGSELLEIVEVQVGDYLGEDDIVRYEDNYGRTSESSCGPVELLSGREK